MPRRMTTTSTGHLRGFRRTTISCNRVRHRPLRRRDDPTNVSVRSRPGRAGGGFDVHGPGRTNFDCGKGAGPMMRGPSVSGGRGFVLLLRLLTITFLLVAVYMVALLSGEGRHGAWVVVGGTSSAVAWALGDSVNRLTSDQMPRSPHMTIRRFALVLATCLGVFLIVAALAYLP